MAKYFLSALLLSACIAQQVACLEGEKFLSFSVDNELKITGAFAQGIEFYRPMKDWMGKKMLDSIPLSTTDRDNLEAGFNTAYSGKEVVEVQYMLGDKKWISQIQPLYQHENYLESVSFFVKVKEAQVENQ